MTTKISPQDLVISKNYDPATGITFTGVVNFEDGVECVADYKSPIQVSTSIEQANLLMRGNGDDYDCID